MEKGGEVSETTLEAPEMILEIMAFHSTAVKSRKTNSGKTKEGSGRSKEALALPDESSGWQSF